ncbi:MAG TPA: HlyD family efflux transporter periplasmic adaptor subunit [Ferruginibacter sp.]|nr:HlyD family efflux transporter periplasmic adaptor subunit [Ferruginibacter sp.]HMP21291.1 HlyD family efflux transporter periplasmic adaptor subunit [Ferruginibacter sp.]
MNFNFIEVKIEEQVDKCGLKSFGNIYRINRASRVKYWMTGILLLLFVILFLPWTQNISARGNVTTLRQEQRPQQMNTIIPGRVVKWFVKEGDYVQQGDTIIQLAEIKDDYLDPNLLGRTKEQLTAKQISVENYRSKVEAADMQLSALTQGRELKVSQLENKIRQQRLKVSADSMDMQAANNDFIIATRQFERQKNMYDSGLVSLTQLEQRNVAYQNAVAKKTSAEIKFINAKQELNILQLELNGAIQDYNEKISKTAGDRFQSLSQIAGGQGDIAKLQNQYMNYDIRSKLYYITAPQSGQVVKARKAGIGEIVKEGEMIVEIVPDHIQYAVEIFVKPVDLPLLDTGQKVRFMFDGFPAIVFSGWPQASYGTFGGKVAAVESSVSTNGKFRVLVAEDPADRRWPPELKMGTGASGFALLKDVPVWYELWRNINGFPAEYYKQTDASGEPKK